ncbi:glycosyltransferase [Novosphingobium album (ex Hu et al. 2023)]|uniref:cellulose synthase (UDP-forming) n=1 Tax=Novosphingobium album (ex Hu et al. 2023) TaxID=2930093 RepID=A0ABT0B7V9_9SPHN|nr:glycosyltransferase [Novosphingobium album (ex Hu et al. 2023)]MCJ2180999.1 glycosyltransferase [Novosphingobium album (ex Hu et al. 2023)]
MPGLAYTAPYAPMALLLGAMLIFTKIWPSRLGLGATVAASIVFYLRWRIFETIPWEEGLSATWWPLVCLTVELVSLFDAVILIAILSRQTNRSAEADEGEQFLRGQWMRDAESLPEVDVFIATYNEPREVLEKTILGCLAIDWPNKKVWVLDDGRRQWLHDLCIAKGAGYINRPNNKGAKAGNINHALMQTGAPFVAVFDADFIPRRDFLLRTMGFFRDDRIGIVQIPHSFYNHDPMQTNLGLQQAMPDDQRFFFEAIMPGRDGWDAAFCCGSNSVTRRSVFEGIGGGLPEGSITEDMLLTLASLRQGYITRYLNEPLAYGLAPESNAAFFVQRQRWAQGAMQILYLRHGPLGPDLKLRYRFLFLPSAWLTQGLQTMFTLLTPIIFLLFNLLPMVNVDPAGIFCYILPMVWALLGGVSALAPGRYYPLAAQILGMFQSFRILPVAIQALIRPKGLIFKVTPKGSDAKGGGNWELGILIAALTLIALNFIGLVINMSPEHRIVSQMVLLPVVAFWVVLNMLMLLMVCMLCLEKPRLRAEERFDIRAGCGITVLNADHAPVRSDRGDISANGLGLQLEEDCAFTKGDRVQVVIPDVGMIWGTVMRGGRRLGVTFDFQSEEARDRLIVMLFTNPIEANAIRPSSLAVSLAVVKRFWAANLHVDLSMPQAHEPHEPEIKLDPATRVIVPAARSDRCGDDFSTGVTAATVLPRQARI